MSSSRYIQSFSSADVQFLKSRPWLYFQLFYTDVHLPPLLYCLSLHFTLELYHMHTGAEVNVHQRDGDVVGVDGEVTHTLITELQTLNVRGPCCRCHSVKTHTGFKIRLNQVKFQKFASSQMSLTLRLLNWMLWFVQCLENFNLSVYAKCLKANPNKILFQYYCCMSLKI